MSTRERMDFPQKEKRIETLVIVAFTIVALVIGAVIVAKNFSPAEPIIDDEIPFHTGDVETQTDDEGNKVVPSGTEEKYIRREGVYNFLFVGYDKAAGLTDVIMIAQFDTNTGAINIVQVPRDTYARYNERGSYRKINGALSYYDRELADFASFLEMNLCLKIDYYASVNLVAFRNIVDIIGGVEMYVPRRMFYDDPEQGLYIDLYEGYQTLDGNKAEQFVRFRSGYVNADIGRTDAQKLFMTAFMKKFISSISVSMLSQVGAQVLKYANTNLTLNEFIYFATKVLDIDLDKLTMMTLPGSDAREYKTYGTWYYVLSRSAMLDTINKYLNVYERDIPDSIFDPNKVFTNPDADYMLELYNTEDLPDVYVGDDVDQSGIYIPARKEQPSVDADAPAEDTTEAVGDTEDTEPVDEPTDETENNDDEY